jgi:hypothetical protein
MIIIIVREIFAIIPLKKYGEAKINLLTTEDLI